MIETIATGSSKVLGLKLCGTLHVEDSRRYVPFVESVLTEEGQVRLYVQLDDFHGWDLRAAWDELKFSLKHYTGFERIAVVGDRQWEHWMARLFKPFTGAKVKYFDKTDIDAAWKWLEETDDALPSDELHRTSDFYADEFNPWRSYY